MRLLVDRAKLATLTLTPPHFLCSMAYVNWVDRCQATTPHLANFYVEAKSATDELPLPPGHWATHTSYVVGGA
jgi:hypothetical protein